MNGPVELTAAQCLELLQRGDVGRVAMSTPVGPRIVPLNYAVHEDAIVFKTAPYSELATYGNNNDVAFEIDHFDHELHLGWSVVAIGRATRVDDPDEIQEIRAVWDPRPWAGGARNLYLRLRWRDLTGRRLGGDWPQQPMAPVRRAV